MPRPPPRPPQEREQWAYRLHALGRSDAEVYYLSPATWSGRHGALWAIVDDLAAAIAAIGATVVIIDSIVPACGAGDVMDPQTAGQYSAAVARLGVPTLSIGHVTKAGANRWPFDSIFWHNLARVTWGLSRADGGLLLQCRKSNAYRKPPSELVTLTHHSDALDVWSKPYAEVFSERVLEVLAEEPMALTPLVQRLNDESEGDEPVKADRVRQVLQRARKKGLVVLEGGRWKR